MNPERRPLLANPRPLLGFFTRLPLGSAGSLDEIIAAFPLAPLVGWLTGSTAGLVAFLLAGRVPEAALSALILALVVGLTGLNQTDGLLDLGDGLMVHGDVERRLKVMHDYSAGVGAVGLVFFTYLVAYGALAGLAGQAAAVGASTAASSAPVQPTGALLTGSPGLFLGAGVLAAEVFARLPYLVLAWRGRPSHSGLGEAFVAGFGTRHLAVGLLVALPAAAAALWLGPVAVALAAAAALLTGAFLRHMANRLLGGVGGDVLGASQELARSAALLGLVLGVSLTT